MCPNFIGTQPLFTVLALPMEHSDYSPLILTASHVDFGPSPFRFYNSWLDMTSFHEFFNGTWESVIGFGSKDKFLLAKLKHVKNTLIKWKTFELHKVVGFVAWMNSMVDELERKDEKTELTRGGKSFLERKKSENLGS